MLQRTTPDRRAAARAAAAAAADAECTFRPATNEAASRQLLARIVSGWEAEPALERPESVSPGPSPAPAEAEAACPQVLQQAETGWGDGRLMMKSPGPIVADPGDSWEEGPVLSTPGASHLQLGQKGHPVQVIQSRASQAARWSEAAARVEIGEVSGEAASSLGAARRPDSCTDATRISNAHSSVS